MRSTLRSLIPYLAIVIAMLPVAVAAQAVAVEASQLEAYSKAYLAIGELRDRYESDAAEPQNKKPEAIAQLQAKLRADVAKVLEEHGLTQDQYTHITFVVSTDGATRRAFDTLLGIEPEEPPAETAASMPANPHIGHVMTSFNGTPGSQGLLATALAEAKVAIDHAQLSANAADDLDAMKLHAGHVIHAIVPEEISRGPGNGYGLKKAATGIATHTDLAAKEQGASETVRTHAVHVITAARTTADRADRVLELARKVSAATTAAEAAPLAKEMSDLAAKLMSGEDADGDGRVTWQQGEGGLEQVEQHLGLMMGE